MTPFAHDVGPCALHFTNFNHTLAGFGRNGGRIAPEWVAGFSRNTQATLTRIPMQTSEMFAVSGVVRDEVRGRPIAGALIFSEAQYYARTSTDSTGRYRLPAIAQGSHIIVAYRPGYYIGRREIGVACDVVVRDTTAGRPSPSQRR